MVRVIGGGPEYRGSNPLYIFTAQTYGTMHSVLSRGHSQARKRIVMFLSVFIFTGLSSKLQLYTFSSLKYQ